MAPRFSLPSSSVGLNRFYVWPVDSTDSYNAAQNAANWDLSDDIIGVPNNGAQWPPTLGVDGGIYGVTQGLQAQINTLQNAPAFANGTLAARPSAGSSVSGAIYIAIDTGGIFQNISSTWVLVSQQALLFPLASLGALTPYDGMEALLQVNATNGPNWRMRYRSASPLAYKWESVGDSPAFSTGFNVTLVRAGNYIIDWALSFFNGGNGGSANAAATSGTLTGTTSLGMSAGSTAGGTGFGSASVAGTMLLSNCNAGCVVSYTWNNSTNQFTNSASSASSASWKVHPLQIS